MKVLVAHPGTQYSHYLVNELHRHGLLFKFVTGFVIPEHSFNGKIYRLLPRFLKSKLNNRYIENLNHSLIEIKWFNELFSMLRMKLNSKGNWIFHRNARFQRGITDEMIIQSDIVIGFDTSSWILAKRCKKLGRIFILDVSIGHPISKEQVFAKIAKQFPNWQDQVTPKSAEYISLELEEINSADYISVPSEFVKNTYLENGVNENKIRVNPFGTNLDFFKNNKSDINRIGTVRFLFFGALTARKGLPTLLEAWKSINTDLAELSIAGYGEMPDSVKLPNGVVNLGPISRNCRQNLFDQNDVLVFPSNFEGFAQVQIEAAACGLPIIGTFNSGVTELVSNNVNGFIVPENNVLALIEAMTYFISNKEKIRIMGNINSLCAQSFSWDAYGKRWCDFISELK